MGATLANPSLDRGFRGRGKTAFERNLLPGFARWMLDQLERREPDFLIPVETKGARVLEAVLRYARDELGEPIGVPVIYASALAYMDPVELRERRVVIVDDAVRTGGSLQRQRDRIERYGPTVIEALACVGDAGERHPDVECYRSVEPDDYRECIWQLAELVVARGLPPEVDHHLFELRLPGGLDPSWWALRALLADYGTVTVDGPDIEGRTLQPLTLHFPELPGCRVKDVDGPHKLRFFFDPANDCIYVVPVSFPPVSLPVPPGAEDLEPEEWRYPAEAAREALAGVVGPGASLGDTMIEQARVRDPETIFATISTTAEFDLIRGLKSLLDRSLPGATIRAQGDQFHRLYGKDAAEPVMVAIEAGLLDVEPATESGWSDLATLESAAEHTPFLDDEVGQKTRDLAAELRLMAKRAKDDEPSMPPKRVGMSMEKLTGFLGGDPLFGSRCVDYGLSMTTLVPFVSLERCDDGVRIERRYRVSEPRNDEDTPYVDMSNVRERLSEETLAAACYCVAKGSERYRDKPLDEDLLASLVGVIGSMVCDEHSIELRAIPGPLGEKIVLCSDDHELTLLDHDPKVMLVVDGGTVEASRRFRDGWGEDELRLDKRKSTEDIEEHVDLLIGFLDEPEAEDSKRLLRAWGMCTDRRLGLTHVRSSLNGAVARMETALKVILRGEKHSPVTVELEPTLEAAREKLDALGHDWTTFVRESWENRFGSPLSKRRERILAGLGAPASGTEVYELPRRLASLIEAIGPSVARLSAASARDWDNEPEPGDAAVVHAAFELCAKTRGALVSFDDQYEPTSSDADPRAAIVAAAEELLDLCDRLRALAAACAGEFRGSLDDYRELNEEDKRSADVLSMDIAGSGEHGRLHNGEEHRKWVNEGLNIATQWSRAFAGRERGRAGDEVWTEFSAGDAPVLAAAAALQLLQALRSTEIEEISWEFHSGVDWGELENERPVNVISHTMDRATKLAKECDPKADEDAVYLTPEAFKSCSSALDDKDLSTRLDEIVLTGDRMHPFAFSADEVMTAFRARIDELVPQLEELGGGAVEDDQIETGAAPAEAARSAKADAG